MPPVTTPSRLRFDPVINWGHILIVVSIILGGITAWSAMLRTSDNHQFQLSDHERRLDRLETVLTGISDAVSDIKRDVAVLSAAQRQRSAGVDPEQR